MNWPRRFARAWIAASTKSPALARRIAFGLLTALACTSLLAQALTPPAGGAYVMREQAIAGGGARATGGIYVLTGTLGQAEADPASAAGGSYRLTGGFHGPHSAGPQEEVIFVDGFEN